MAISREKFIENQIEACKKAGLPEGTIFMNKNGICWNCKKDVLQRAIDSGKDGTEMITGCNFCYRTYCD